MTRLRRAVSVSEETRGDCEAAEDQDEDEGDDAGGGAGVWSDAGQCCAAV